MEVFWVCVFLLIILYSQLTLGYIFFVLGLYLFCLATAETTVGLLIVFFQNNLLKKQFFLDKTALFYSKSYIKSLNAKIK